MKEKARKYASDRFWKMFVVFAVFAMACIGGIVKLMFFDSQYWETVFQNYSNNSYEEPAERGSIISADGKELSVSLPEYDIAFDPIVGNKVDRKNPKTKKKQQQLDSLLVKKADSIVWGLKKILPNVEPAQLKKDLLQGRAKEKRYIKLYNKRVSYLQLLEIKKLPLCDKPYHCLKAEARNRRKYPYGRMAIRTIGRMHKKEDVPETALEYEFNEDLKGIPGKYHYEKVRGQSIKTIDVPSQRGADLHTTLDVDMQDMVEKTMHKHLRAMNARLGVCILMEVATGDVKAISSLTRLKDGTFREIQSPAVAHMRMPGSTVKVASIMTALDDGRISMADSVNTGNGVKQMYGEYMKDSDFRRGGNGVLSVLGIMAKSSNVGIATLIDNAYRKDPQTFIAGWQRTGLLEDLKLPIRGYAKPTTPIPGQRKWAKTTLPWLSVGYESQIPPISILNFYNGIANGGRLMRPRFVTAVKKGNQVVREYPPVVIRENMCKPSTLQNVQKCLEAAVALKGSTGKLANSRHFTVAGKTGTAQIWENDKKTDDYFISFVGYFPANAPLYSMIVCIEKKVPAYGGLHCAPIFKELAERVMVRKYKEDYVSAVDAEHYRHMPNVKAGNVGAMQRGLIKLLNWQPVDKNEKYSTPWGSIQTEGERMQLVLDHETKHMPDLFNYSLRDAVFRLEKMGLRVKVKGIGAVTWQSIPPQHRVKRGDTVELYLNLTPNRNVQSPPISATQGNEKAEKAVMSIAQKTREREQAKVTLVKPKIMGESRASIPSTQQAKTIKGERRKTKDTPETTRPKQQLAAPLKDKKEPQPKNKKR